MEHMQDDYETLVTSLLEWIRGKTSSLNDRHFDNSLEGIKKDMYKFTEYRVVEKPPKSVLVNLITFHEALLCS